MYLHHKRCTLCISFIFSGFGLGLAPALQPEDVTSRPTVPGFITENIEGVKISTAQLIGALSLFLLLLSS